MYFNFFRYNFSSYISESYVQGLRRMNRAYSETIVHLDEQNCSEEEMNPFKLS